MRILVTGGSGFVGSFLVEALIARGFDVAVLVRNPSGGPWLSGLDCELIPGDLSTPGIGKAVEGRELIFHVAGLTKALRPSQFDDVNQGGTRRLVQACLESGRLPSRFVHISSLAVVGPSEAQRPVDETTECRPVTPYGRSKLAGERELEGLPPSQVTILRPPIVYGPRDPALLSVFQAVRRGLAPRLGRFERHYSVIHVRDLVRGIVEAALSPSAAGQTYFLTQEPPTTWSELLSEIRGAVRPGAREIVLPMPLVTVAAAFSGGWARLAKKATWFGLQKLPEIRAAEWLCSGEKARRDFGFESEVSIEEGIRETAGWYAETGWI